MIEQFKGFRGVAALCQIGKVQFIVLAKNKSQLAAIHRHILPEAPPFNPDDCQKSVVIRSKHLSKSKSSHE